MRKIILFELNEVPYRVIDQFCIWRPNSCLARYMSRFRQVQTFTEDRKLSPWTTWPTLHRGVTDTKHTIHEFGQELSEINVEFPSVWELLARNGVSVGVCGSLHTYPPPTLLANYDFFIPDTFAAGAECVPEEVRVFQEFNLSMARESARVVSRKVNWKGALEVLSKSGSLGLQPSTLFDVGMQLIGETVQSWKSIRRRTYQSVLMFDVFLKQLKTKKPNFVTFFTNHVASSMHRYWAATFPDDYASFEFTQEWVGRYRNEIDWTLSKFDGFLSQLIEFVDQNPEYVIWIATSMGQAATVAKELETELLITDLTKFMRRLGLDDLDWTVKPAMVPQVNFVVKESKVPVAREAFEALKISENPVMVEEHGDGFFSLSFGQVNLHDWPNAITFRNEIVAPGELGLTNVRIDDKCGATAYHVRQGSLLVYDPKEQGPQVGRLECSTTALAPAMLKNFGVDAPQYMTKDVPSFLVTH